MPKVSGWPPASSNGTPGVVEELLDWKPFFGLVSLFKEGSYENPLFDLVSLLKRVYD